MGKKQQPEYDVGFVPLEFRNAFVTWLDYKWNEFKDTYKSQQSLEICFKKLQRESGGNPEVATVMIDNAIGNHWKGFFPLKTNELNGIRQSATGKATEPDARQQRFNDWMRVSGQVR